MKLSLEVQQQPKKRTIELEYVTDMVHYAEEVSAAFDKCSKNHWESPELRLELAEAVGRIRGQAISVKSML